MSLEKSTINWSAKQVKNLVSNERINFTHIVQRSYVWEISRRSKLIESMILGYPIPQVFAKRVDGDSKVYYIMDGKQRLITISRFLDNKFQLSNLDEITYYDDSTDDYITLDISGRLFKELPESLQDLLNNIQITTVYFDNLSLNEEKELFKRLNNGKPLRAKEKLIASCNDLDVIVELGQHEVFSMLKGDYTNENNKATFIMKTYISIYSEVENINFDSVEMNKEIEKIVINDFYKTEILELFDFYVELFEKLIELKVSQLVNKISHEYILVALAPFIKKILDNQIESKLAADWLIVFLGIDAKKNEEFNQSINKKTATKNIYILERYNIIAENFNKFFDSDEMKFELKNNNIF